MTNMTNDGSSPGAALRVSDTEREAVATRLREAAAEGRLTLDEADQRQADAYAARTRDDLAVLTTDLPVPVRTGRGALTDAAKRRLAVHAAIVAVIAVALVTRWAIGPVWWFWPAWPLLWLSVSLLVHHRRAAREPAPAMVAA